MARDLVDHHLEQLFAHIDVFTVLFHHLAPVTLLDCSACSLTRS
jgi:hypothetical protein